MFNNTCYLLNSKKIIGLKMVKKRYLVIFIILILPFVLNFFSYLDTSRGLIWFFAQQIYYVPISWIGEPFFIKDSETMFVVKPLGKIITFFVYLTVIVAFHKIVVKIRNQK